VPGDPVAEVVAHYRDTIDALRDGRTPDRRAMKALLGSAYTRGHFARAV